MKAKVISIVGQKGGIAKTTTSAALCNALTSKGYKCLAIDINAQRNLSQCFNADNADMGVTDVLLNPACIREAITQTEQGDILAGDKNLANIDILQERAGIDDKYTALKEALSIIGREYQYIVCDTPPYIGCLWLNAMLASDYYVICAEADAFSITSVQDVISNIKDIKSNNKSLKAAGILVTRYAGRATLSRQLLEVFNEPAKSIHTSVFSVPIREGVAIREAHIMRQSLYDYAPKSNPAKDYMTFTEELLTRIGK